MKQKFSVSVYRDKDWFVAQALNVDVASQGATVEESLENSKEVLEPHFGTPAAISAPQIGEFEVEVVAG